MENKSLRYESKSLLAKLQDLDGAHVKTLNEDNGDYMVNVRPYSVKFVTDLIGAHLGTANYEISYDAHTVTWNIAFNILGKKRLVI